MAETKFVKTKKEKKESYFPIESSSIDSMRDFCKTVYEDKKFIPNKSFIDYYTLTKLRNLVKETSLATVLNCIEINRADITKKYSFLVEDRCEYCGELIQKEISKTQLVKVISSKATFVCTNCAERKKEKEISERELLNKKLSQQSKAITENFINSFCNPSFVWNEDIKPTYYFYKMQTAFNYYVDRDKVIEALKKLSYKDFLATPYWKAISQKKRKKANYCCELCGSHTTLNVHHRTYKHHGDEMHHLEDLICLCKNCHSKFHDKLGGED